MKALNAVIQKSHRLYQKITQSSKATKFRKIFYHIAHRHQYAMLLTVFLLLWHPGFYSRELPAAASQDKKKHSTIPDRKNFPFKDQWYLEINLNKNWIILKNKNKQVASYPIVHSKIITGKYYVEETHSEKNILTDDKGKLKFGMGWAGLSTGPGILLEQDHWQMLSPYLRRGMILKIK